MQTKDNVIFYTEDGGEWYECSMEEWGNLPEGLRQILIKNEGGVRFVSRKCSKNAGFTGKITR